MLLIGGFIAGGLEIPMASMPEPSLDIRLMPIMEPELDGGLDAAAA